MKYLSLTVAILVLVALICLFIVDPTEGNRAERRVANRARARNANNNGTATTNTRRRGNGQSGTRRNRQRGRGRNRAGRRQGGRRRGGAGGRARRLERFGCEEIYLPMCKGLVKYTHTKLPNQFNHTTQAEVFRHMGPLVAYLDHSCSRNMRAMVCAMYLPKCHGRRPGMGPCKRTCQVAKRKCSGPLSQQLSLEWEERFPDCNTLPNRRCVRPMRDTRCRYPYPNCVANEQISACKNLTFTWGTLPNMFGQCHIQDINLELRQYETLQATNCHEQLNFFLCGIHSPFCVRNEVPFTFPCRELCEQVRTSCESDYRRLNHNLPWPNKLQCHRYPTSDQTDYQCVMPGEGEINGAA